MQTTSSLNLTKWAILLGTIAFLFLFQQFAFIGHYGYDDLNYARIANSLNHGSVDFNDHFTYRWGLILPMTFFYKLFGVNDFASALPALISAVIILCIVFYILYKQPPLIIGVAISLSTLTLWNLSYALKIMADLPLAASFLVIILFLYKFYFSASPKHNALYAVFISFSFFYGFLVKETIILVLPLLTYLALYDFWHKRHVKFWMLTFFVAVAFFILYFILVKLLTGNFLGRFDAIIQNSYLNRCSYGDQPLGILLKRIGYEFVAMFIKQGMFIAPALALALAFNTSFKQILSFKTEKHFFVLASVLLLLSSNFMTISVTSYNPMCLDPRHYLFLTPICAIATAYFFIDAKLNSNLIWTGFIIMLLGAIANYWFTHQLFNQPYLTIAAILLIWGLFLKAKPISQATNLFIGCIAISTFFYPLQEFRYARNINYNEQKKTITEWLISLPDSSIIISDEVQKRYNPYFLEYQNPQNLVFLNFKQTDSLTQKDNCTFYIIKNQYTSTLSGQNPKHLPNFMKFADSSYHEISNKLNGNLIIFSLNNLYGKYSIKPLASFINTFDSIAPNWNQQEHCIKNEGVLFEGNYYLIPEYSATLQIQIDSLAGKTLQISAQAMINSFAESNPKLIISLDNNSGPAVWESYEISEIIKSYGAWWGAKSEVIIDKSNIINGSVLKVYVWNPDKTILQIDNFSVTINELK